MDYKTFLMMQKYIILVMSIVKRQALLLVVMVLELQEYLMQLEHIHLTHQFLVLVQMVIAVLLQLLIQFV